MQQTPQYNSGLCMQAIQSHSSLTSSTQPLSNWPETAEWHFIYSSQVFWLLLSVALLAKTPPTSALSCDNNFALSQIPFWWQTQAVFPNAIPEGDRGLYLGITESFEPRLVFSAPCTTCTGVPVTDMFSLASVSHTEALRYFSIGLARCVHLLGLRLDQTTCKPCKVSRDRSVYQHQLNLQICTQAPTKHNMIIGGAADSP